VVDGSEGGTGAAPVEFVDNIGMPMRDGLRLVHASLLGAGLRDQIRIGVAGKIVSAFDMMRALAIGADWCNSARGFMFAIGCIQSRSCHTDHCPTGVATQDRLRQSALNPADKSERVYRFHRETLIAFADMCAAAGIQSHADITEDLILRRNSQGKLVTLLEGLMIIPPGALITDKAEQILDTQMYGLGRQWREAQAAVW
jgi:glutamate synthase domain-containing protein 2